LPLSRDADRFLAGSPASVPISVFVTRGYAALLTDLVIGPEGTAGDPLDNMVDVLLPQIYHASELGYIDIKRVALIGQSYGGYSTAGILTKTNLFRAAVAIAGLYDLAGDYAWMSHGITPFMNWSESGQGRMGTHPWGDLQRYIANSPYYRADKINTPLLLIHGSNDDGSPVEGAEKMFIALKRLNKTAQLAIYEKEGHTVDNWSLAKAVDATERILKFLNTYLHP
jgi:dipeptidyl aminopeptidase/acylaminoacyl peptidase